MNDPQRGAPERPELDTAGTHRETAERAAAQGDFDTALRERFRAVLRGLEQHGVLKVRRSRTAHETAHEAAAALPPADIGDLPVAADTFDRVVYGGRRATADEYHRLARADRFSAGAPPPAVEPMETDTGPPPAARSRASRDLFAVLRDPRWWAALAATAVVLLLVYAMAHGCSGPSAPTTPNPPDPPPPDNSYDRDIPRPTGDDSLFSRTPDRLVFGGLQFLFAGVLLVWWRARRRGAVVTEPRPVEVAAGELLAGQAGLYRRSRDHAHIAEVLRAATVRRLRRALGAGAGTSPEALVAAIAAHTGAGPDMIGAALHAPVKNTRDLELVAAQLEWIEAEVG